jgi:hypothetical protein
LGGISAWHCFSRQISITIPLTRSFIHLSLVFLSSLSLLFSFSIGSAVLLCLASLVISDDRFSLFSFGWPEGPGLGRTRQTLQLVLAYTSRVGAFHIGAVFSCYYWYLARLSGQGMAIWVGAGVLHCLAYVTHEAGGRSLCMVVSLDSGSCLGVRSLVLSSFVGLCFVGNGEENNT